jgi:ferredoxin
MTYVITDPCNGTKDGSCIEVCPVDCIHPTPGEAGFADQEMLHIDPRVCIDCDACLSACPVSAILPAEEVPAIWRRYIDLNAAYFEPRG